MKLVSVMMKKLSILKRGRQIAMSCMAPGMDLTGVVRERKKNTDLTYGEKLGLCGLDSVGEPPVPRSEIVYYIR